MSRSGGYDRHITIFSPDGRLYQIEYAFKAVTGCGLTSVCLRGKDTVCTVVQKKVPDKLMDSSYVTSLYKITDSIGACVIGLVPDSKALVMKVRMDAAEFKQENGYEIPVHFLAQKVAKYAQVYTQHAGIRPLGCHIQLMAVDDERGPQLYAVNPAGHYFGWKANAAGAKQQEASNALEKVIKKFGGNTDRKETIQQAIDVLQVVLSQDLKPTDIEVAIVTRENKYVVLSDSEVEDQLNQIAEKD